MVVHVEYNQGIFFFTTEFEASAKQVISSSCHKVSSTIVKYKTYVFHIITYFTIFISLTDCIFLSHTYIEKQTPTKTIKLLEETRAKHIYKKNASFFVNNWWVGKVNDTIRYLTKLLTNMAFGQVVDKNIKVQCIAISLSFWNLHLYHAQYSLSPSCKGIKGSNWHVYFLWFLISRPSLWPITFILPSTRKRFLDLLIAYEQSMIKFMISNFPKIFKFKGICKNESWNSVLFRFKLRFPPFLTLRSMRFIR